MTVQAVHTVQPEREKTMWTVGAVIFTKNIKVECFLGLQLNRLSFPLPTAKATFYDKVCRKTTAISALSV
jgi:hypothetical protein